MLLMENLRQTLAQKQSLHVVFTSIVIEMSKHRETKCQFEMRFELENELMT